MKRIVSILAVLAMLMVFAAACADDPPAPPEAPDEAPAEAPVEAPAEAPAEASADGERELTFVIGVSEMSAHPFFMNITAGMRSVLEPAGFEVITRAGDYDVTTQLTDMEDFIAQGVDGIIASPASASAAKAVFEQAQAAGIPIVIVDNPSPDLDLIVANVATENYMAGVQAARQVIEDIGTEGEVAVLHMVEWESCVKRYEGFRDTLAAEAPGIEIVAVLDYAGMEDAAMSNTEDLMTANPGVAAIFAVNEAGAFGAFAALVAMNRTDVLIYSVDGSTDFINAILAGDGAGTAAQATWEMGVKAAEIMLDVLLRGVYPTEQNIWIDPLWLTADTPEIHTFVGF